jgi:hypothetical protein
MEARPQEAENLKRRALIMNFCRFDFFHKNKPSLNYYHMGD